MIYNPKFNIVFSWVTHIGQMIIGYIVICRCPCLHGKKYFVNQVNKVRVAQEENPGENVSCWYPFIIHIFSSVIDTEVLKSPTENVDISRT